MFECIGHEVEKHPLDFLRVNRQNHRCVAGYIDLKMYVMLPRHRAERLRPFGDHPAEIDLFKAQVEFAVFIFTEVKYLVDKATQYLDIFIGYLHKGVLLRGEIGSVDHLLDRFGNESERCAQVV